MKKIITLILSFVAIICTSCQESKKAKIDYLSNIFVLSIPHLNYEVELHFDENNIWLMNEKISGKIVRIHTGTYKVDRSQYRLVLKLDKIPIYVDYLKDAKFTNFIEKPSYSSTGELYFDDNRDLVDFAEGGYIFYRK